MKSTKTIRDRLCSKNIHSTNSISNIYLKAVTTSIITLQQNSVGLIICILIFIKFSTTLLIIKSEFVFPILLTTLLQSRILF